jgi:hypothetical protein
LRLEALEVSLAVRCRGSGAYDLAEAVRSAWDWCLLEDSYAADEDGVQDLTVVLDPDPDSLARAVATSSLIGSDLRTVMDRLSPLVTREAIAARRSELVMFHGCAVADPETGATVVLYGPSGAGKTTLARTLCTDLVYLSDETAGVAQDLRVVPYCKPLSIIVRSAESVKEQVSPGRLDLVRPSERRYQLAALVQLSRDPAHVGPATLERVATVDGLPELTAQTSYTREMERPLHRLAELAERVGGMRRVTYAEAEQVRPIVRAILDAEA